jgi:hypothetical protein
MKTHDDSGAEIEPPSNALMFEYSISLRILMLGCAIVCGAFISAVVVMQLTQPGRGSLLLVILVFALFGTGGIYSLQMARRFRDRIAVNSEGIWCLGKEGPSSFIAWPEVAAVKANDTMQRLTVTDASETRNIRVEYQLSKFASLREFILSHASADALQAYSALRLFHRSWINKVILTILALPYLLIVAFDYRGGSAGPQCCLLALGACPLVIAAFDPVNLTIDSGGFVIRYPLWKRFIPFDSISGITLKDVRSRGNVWPAVVIERPGKRRIRLFRFREGSIALRDSLQSAWYGDQASQVRTGAQSAVRYE